MQKTSPDELKELLPFPLFMLAEALSPRARWPCPANSTVASKGTPASLKLQVLVREQPLEWCVAMAIELLHADLVSLRF